ncbi:MAG: thioredoxin [Candidatus Diapherotrites archaeon]|nr:thioredoxin [Candidatus Diapherotrites archaeon]
MDVTDKNFQEEVLEKSKELPVVVDFWAPWCGPCLYLGPIIEKVAEEYNGKIILVKVNVDESQLIAGKYRIMGIPTVIMFKNGVKVASFSGAIPEDEVKKWLENNL